MAVGDLDGGGLEDLLLGFDSVSFLNLPNYYVIYWNWGNWSFTQGERRSFATTSPLEFRRRGNLILLGDFNLDGMDDMVAKSGYVALSLGDGILTGCSFLAATGTLILTHRPLPLGISSRMASRISCLAEAWVLAQTIGRLRFYARVSATEASTVILYWVS